MQSLIFAVIDTTVAQVRSWRMTACELLTPSDLLFGRWPLRRNIHAWTIQVCSNSLHTSKNTKSLTHSLPDTDYYQELFEHACRGRLKHVKTSLQALKEKSLPVPLQPLATLAADRGFPDILNFCLSQGAVFDPDLDMAALYATKTPGMLDVLMAQNWRNIAFSESARKETGCVPGSKSPQRPPMPTLPGGYATTLTPEQIEERFGDINW
jgi:hypothetical protein